MMWRVELNLKTAQAYIKFMAKIARNVPLTGTEEIQEGARWSREKFIN